MESLNPVYTIIIASFANLSTIKFPKKPVDRTGKDSILYIHRERRAMRHKSDFGPPIV